MPTKPPVVEQPLDQLEREIVSVAGRMNQTEYQFLVLVREFDLREGWKAEHFNNCAEWLDMKCGISYGAAREKMRVAHALTDLPKTSAAFGDGHLSYSKARALTRLATRENEAGLLDHALHSNVRQVENHCRQLRNVQRAASTADVNCIHERRYLNRTYHGDGSMSISLELTREAGDLVMKAIEIAMATQTRETEQAEEANFHARQVDGLVAVARSYLAGGSEKSTSSADHYQVLVQVDEAALRGAAEDDTSGAKSDLPIESVRRLCCDSSVVPVSRDKKGNPLNAGRKQRVVQPALRRALLARDKSCKFPGCSHEKWLDAHHVMHWIDGGETSLANTLLLCSRHHRLLHEGGFSIRKGLSGEWQFLNAEGQEIAGGLSYGTEVKEPEVDYLASHDIACRKSFAVSNSSPPADPLQPASQRGQLITVQVRGK